MALQLETRVLKAVSRSFYLSLRLLPSPMRRGASVGYLLARTSDTIADSATLPTERRIALLDRFLSQIKGETKVSMWPEDLIAGVDDEGESELLRMHVQAMEAFGSLGGGEAELVRDVVGTIIGGQRLDLQRFGEATAEKVVALPDEKALDDYAWRVAGCVGVFWTKLGYLTMGESFSRYPEEELLVHAVEYGKGLQLVNILRDLPKDLRMGRCYLPVDEPNDRSALMESFETQRLEAEEKVSHGISYAGKLRGKRLRLSSRLPAMIAAEMLRELEGISFGKLEDGYKLPRKRIYLMILGGFVSA